MADRTPTSRVVVIDLDGEPFTYTEQQWGDNTSDSSSDEEIIIQPRKLLPQPPRIKQRRLQPRRLHFGGTSPLSLPPASPYRSPPAIWPGMSQRAIILRQLQMVRRNIRSTISKLESVIAYIEGATVLETPPASDDEENDTLSNFLRTPTSLEEKQFLYSSSDSEDSSVLFISDGE